jgi:hypothetical protein
VQPYLNNLTLPLTEHKRLALILFT